MGDSMIHAERSFEMAHRVPDFGYGEDSIHGHTWKIEVTAIHSEDMDTPAEPQHVLQLLTENVVDVFDRGLVVWSDDDHIDAFKRLRTEGMSIFIVDFSPTADNLATHLFAELKVILDEEGFDLRKLTLREGPNIAVTVDTGV